jgi:hypothetical protein
VYRIDDLLFTGGLEVQRVEIARFAVILEHDTVRRTWRIGRHNRFAAGHVFSSNQANTIATVAPRCQAVRHPRLPVVSGNPVSQPLSETAQLPTIQTGWRATSHKWALASRDLGLGSVATLSPYPSQRTRFWFTALLLQISSMLSEWLKRQSWT